MAIEYIVFDGKNSKDFGIWSSGSGTYGGSKRAVDKVKVDGHNGALIYDLGRYENSDIEYQCLIYQNYDKNIEDARTYFLNRSNSYYKLEDTLHPEEYRMARFSGDFKVESLAKNQLGKFKLKFDCKPQRFLKDGEIFCSVNADGTVFVNPTEMEAKPLIRVTGYGTLKVGTETLIIANYGLGTIDIDCDLQNVSNGIDNLNSYVTLSSGEFPTFKDNTRVEYYGNIRSVVVKPRWWRL